MELRVESFASIVSSNGRGSDFRDVWIQPTFQMRQIKAQLEELLFAMHSCVPWETESMANCYTKIVENYPGPELELNEQFLKEFQWADLLLISLRKDSMVSKLHNENLPCADTWVMTRGPELPEELIEFFELESDSSGIEFEPSDIPILQEWIFEDLVPATRHLLKSC